MHARVDLPHRRYALLPGLGDGPPSVSHYSERFPVRHRQRDKGPDDGEGGKAPGHAGGMRRRRQQRHRYFLRFHKGRGGGAGRMRGRRQGNRHLRDRSHDKHREAGHIPRDEVLFLPGRVRPDSSGVFDIRRPGLSGDRPGACVAPRHIPRPLCCGNRRAGGEGFRVSVAHRRDNPGDRVVPRPGFRDGAGSENG